MFITMFSGDMFPFSTRYLKSFWFCTYQINLIAIPFLEYSLLKQVIMIMIIIKKIISDENNDNHNTDYAFRTYISIKVTYQVISSLIFQVPGT